MPDIATSGSLGQGVFLISEGAVVVGSHAPDSDNDSDFVLTTAQVPDLADVTAAVGTWLPIDAMVLTDDPAIVGLNLCWSLDDRQVVEAERIPLPAGDYAPVLAAEDIEEHLLGETVEVVSAEQHGLNHLYVGRTTGVLVHSWEENFEDGSVCVAPLLDFEVGR